MQVYVQAVVILAVSLIMSAQGETLAERFLKGYDSISSLSCEVRKDIDAPSGSMRMLSRVYYQKPERLHVENLTPIPRRIIADGSNLFSYIEGDAKGFSRPITRLDKEMLISLRSIPGTPMEHLLRLKGIEEVELPPLQDFPLRRGYAADNIFVVLACDTSNRLARIEFFNSADRAQTVARYTYSQFKEIMPGVWLSCWHKAELFRPEGRAVETRKISNITIDQPLAPGLFMSGSFFKGISFVDSFDDMYP